MFDMNLLRVEFVGSWLKTNQIVLLSHFFNFITFFLVGKVDAGLRQAKCTKPGLSIERFRNYLSIKETLYSCQQKVQLKIGFIDLSLKNNIFMHFYQKNSCKAFYWQSRLLERIRRVEENKVRIRNG